MLVYSDDSYRGGDAVSETASSGSGLLCTYVVKISCLQSRQGALALAVCS
jgi:hypothetical protein